MKMDNIKSAIWKVQSVCISNLEPDILDSALGSHDASLFDYVLSHIETDNFANRHQCRKVRRDRSWTTIYITDTHIRKNGIQ